MRNSESWPARACSTRPRTLASGRTSTASSSGLPGGQLRGRQQLDRAREQRRAVHVLVVGGVRGQAGLQRAQIAQLLLDERAITAARMAIKYASYTRMRYAGDCASVAWK